MPLLVLKRKYLDSYSEGIEVAVHRGTLDEILAQLEPEENVWSPPLRARTTMGAEGSTDFYVTELLSPYTSRTYYQRWGVKVYQNPKRNYQRLYLLQHVPVL